MEFLSNSLPFMTRFGANAKVQASEMELYVISLHLTKFSVEISFNHEIIHLKIMLVHSFPQCLI